MGDEQIERVTAAGPRRRVLQGGNKEREILHFHFYVCLGRTYTIPCCQREEATAWTTGAYARVAPSFRFLS